MELQCTPTMLSTLSELPARTQQSRINTPLVLVAAIFYPYVLLANEASPRHVVEAFHKALQDGAREAALALLSPNVVIFESGGAELSREEYASHHLEADLSFSKTVDRKVTWTRDKNNGDLAWVLSRGTTTGNFRGKSIHSRFAESMVLVREDDGWRIAHVHWSSRPVKRPDNY